MTERSIVVTGFPMTLIAQYVVRGLLEKDRSARIICIVPERLSGEARALLDRMEGGTKRVELLEGDASAMDLGLSGKEFLELAAKVQVIHHCASVAYAGADRALAEQTNIGGTREVLELAEAATGLERLVHWSTALVAGARRDRVLEDDLDSSQSFRSVMEETRFRAERLLRNAAERVPLTVLRPSNIVGDSATGAIDRFDGPYLLVLLMLNSPMDLGIPVPGRADTPLHVVPIDYVVAAGLHIVSIPESLGRTFHLVDPSPPTVRHVFERIAREVGRAIPRTFVPVHLATALLRTPGLEKFANAPRSFLEQLATEVVYDDRNTRDALSGTGIECPRFDDYASAMVRYVRGHQAEKRARRNENMLAETDPLS